MINRKEHVLISWWSWIFCVVPEPQEVLMKIWWNFFCICYRW